MKLFRLSISVILGLVASVSIAATAHAATFVVDSTSDQSDGVPGNGVCLTIVNTCTLRAAIEEANAFAGADIVNFNIVGAGVQTIAPASVLPAITETIVIDGSTQPGATCGDLVPDALPAQSNTPHNLLIQITRTEDNVNEGILSIYTGVAEDASDSIIKGLVINSAGTNSQFNAISIYSDYNNASTNISIECNYIGTDLAGTTGDDTTYYGIDVQNISYIHIVDNLISANGVGVQAPNVYVAIESNLIGTDITGNVGLDQDVGIAGNFYAGISSSMLTGNIVSGNQSTGIDISGEGFIVNSNYIGLSLNGNALGNGSDGVIIGSSSLDYIVGGVTAGDRNVISANQGNGLKIYNYLQTGQGCPSSINSVGAVQGNYIGTNTAGIIQVGYGNTGSGVQVNEVTDSTNCVQSIYKIQLGGTETGNANTIAGNIQDGVRIFQSINADVFSISTIGNSIFGNGNLGINLAADSDDDGVADIDLGPNVINNFLLSYPVSNANNYLNSLVINSTETNGNQLTINYNFQAPPGVTESAPALLSTDLIGYQLDFYLNATGQDGAYADYAQGKTHLGSFIVNGSETNASHTFTSPVTPVAGQNITATATVLWKNIPCPNANSRGGDGPPYSACAD